MGRARPRDRRARPIGRSHSRWHGLCHLAALGLVASYGFIGHELARGLGFDIGYGRAFAVFSNGLMAAYLAPVPGSYGVGEGFTAWLLDPQLPAEALAAGVLSRVLCWHIMFIPGAIILFRADSAGTATRPGSGSCGARPTPSRRPHPGDRVRPCSLTGCSRGAALRLRERLLARRGRRVRDRRPVVLVPGMCGTRLDTTRGLPLWGTTPLYVGRPSCAGPTCARTAPAPADDLPGLQRARRVRRH